MPAPSGHPFCPPSVVILFFLFFLFSQVSWPVRFTVLTSVYLVRLLYFDCAAPRAPFTTFTRRKIGFHHWMNCVPLSVCLRTFLAVSPSRGTWQTFGSSLGSRNGGRRRGGPHSSKIICFFFTSFSLERVQGSRAGCVWITSCAHTCGKSSPNNFLASVFFLRTMVFVSCVLYCCVYFGTIVSIFGYIFIFNHIQCLMQIAVKCYLACSRYFIAVVVFFSFCLILVFVLIFLCIVFVCL